MRERPLPFSAQMVRAYLDGRKMQTRLVAKTVGSGYVKEPRGHRRWHPDDPEAVAACPCGGPGDRLWVKETWQAWQCVSHEYDDWEPITREARGGARWAEWMETNGRPDRIEYRATSKSLGPWISAIHMPRWASRITLEIAEVRLESLQNISEADAVAEGVGVAYRDVPVAMGNCKVWRDYSDMTQWQTSARSSYRSLWESIHGPGSWAENPWVWVITFPRFAP